MVCAARADFENGCYDRNQWFFADVGADLMSMAMGTNVARRSAARLHSRLLFRLDHRCLQLGCLSVGIVLTDECIDGRGRHKHGKDTSGQETAQTSPPCPTPQHTCSIARLCENGNGSPTPLARSGSRSCSLVGLVGRSDRRIARIHRRVQCQRASRANATGRPHKKAYSDHSETLEEIIEPAEFHRPDVGLTIAIFDEE